MALPTVFEGFLLALSAFGFFFSLWPLFFSLLMMMAPLIVH
jgi:hypothetical protein